MSYEARQMLMTLEGVERRVEAFPHVADRMGEKDVDAVVASWILLGAAMHEAGRPGGQGELRYVSDAKRRAKNRKRAQRRRTKR